MYRKYIYIIFFFLFKLQDRHKWLFIYLFFKYMSFSVVISSSSTKRRFHYVPVQCSLVLPIHFPPDFKLKLLFYRRWQYVYRPRWTCKTNRKYNIIHDIEGINTRASFIFIYYYFLYYYLESTEIVYPFDYYRFSFKSNIITV